MNETAEGPVQRAEAAGAGERDVDELAEFGRSEG